MAGVYGSHSARGSNRGSRNRDRDESGPGEYDYGDGGSEAPDWAIDFNEVELGELVATGSFGVVHSAKYQGQRVAVKFLLFPEASNTEELERAKRGFWQEVDVWRRLQHPNVVQFLGAYVSPPKWAIVTEFLDGGTLKGFLSRIGSRKLSTKQVVCLALDVARGMRYLHRNNVIHRDLKSANLLLNGDGGVKVADFGLAREESQEPGNMTGETGTIRWMAPEMIDHKPYSRKVDVYSFGIVLWEMVTGLNPFDGISFVQLAHAIVADCLRPPVPPDCPSTLAKLMTQCWDANPDERPDFEDVVKVLEGLLPATAPAAARRGGSRVEDSLVPNDVNGDSTGSGSSGRKDHSGGGGGSIHHQRNHSGGGGGVGPNSDGNGVGATASGEDGGWKKLSVEPRKTTDAVSTGCGCVIS